jgi:hypothetical protein
LLRPGPNIAASAVILGLMLWFLFEIDGGALGLAERCAAVAAALWLFPVAFGARRVVVPGEAVERDGVAHVAVGSGRLADPDRSDESRRVAAT